MAGETMEHASAGRGRRDWGRALRAVRGLIADPERTDLVFEILDSLSGPAFERSYRRFCDTPQSARLRTEKPILIDRLRDHEGLAALPVGSLGRAYLDFMTRGGLSADGLVEAEQIATKQTASLRPEVDDEHEWFGNRMRDAHDLWHVVTGYGMDDAGEGGLLAFTLAQVPNAGIALIVGAAALVGPWRDRLHWPRYLLEAWHRGRLTPDLAPTAWEELLPLPLAEVRHRLGVPSPARAHPGGVAVAVGPRREQVIEYRQPVAIPA